MVRKLKGYNIYMDIIIYQPFVNEIKELIHKKHLKFLLLGIEELK